MQIHKGDGLWKPFPNIYLYQIITLYTLNIYTIFICQSYLNKLVGRRDLMFMDENSTITPNAQWQGQVERPIALLSHQSRPSWQRV